MAECDCGGAGGGGGGGDGMSCSFLRLVATVAAWFCTVLLRPELVTALDRLLTGLLDPGAIVGETGACIGDCVGGCSCLGEG